MVPLAALLMLYRPGTREALLAAVLLGAMAWRWLGTGAGDGFAVFGIAWTLLPEFERAIKLEEGILRFLTVQMEGEMPAPIPAEAAAVVAAEEEDE